MPAMPAMPAMPTAPTAGTDDLDDHAIADASTPDSESTTAEPTFEAAPDAHLDILRALERGEIDVAEASGRLAALEGDAVADTEDPTHA
jgi:hypothetical protein